jgi:hypothetical protein
MFDTEDVGVFLGLGVGKTAHHGHGLTPADKKVLDKPLPDSEPKLRAVLDKLTVKFGTVLVIVDQPASIGALPLTVARDADCKVAYLPGLAMRRIADLYPGEAKTDAKGAAVIADAARTMPPHLALGGTARRSNRRTDSAASTRTSRPRRPAPTTGHAACSPSSTRRWTVCSALGWTSRSSPAARALRLSGRPAKGRPPQTRRAHPAQGPTHGQPADRRRLYRLPSLARSLAAVHEQRRVEAQINALLETHLLSNVLTSMPGVGVRTAAVLLVTVGEGTSFPNAAHLASYAGLAPTTKSSGTSIHGEHASRGGTRQLKRAMSLSAFACMNADAASRTYYDKQRARGKSHTQALLPLTRQRISVLFAMLRDGTFYEPRLHQATAA